MPEKRRRSSRTKQESKKKLSQKLPLILMVLGVLLLVSVFAFGIYAKMSQTNKLKKHLPIMIRLYLCIMDNQLFKRLIV